MARLQAEDRGKAFGVLLFSGSMGGMLGSLYATNLGSLTTNAIIARHAHASTAMCCSVFCTMWVCTMYCESICFRPARLRHNAKHMITQLHTLLVSDTVYCTST